MRPFSVGLLLGAVVGVAVGRSAHNAHTAPVPRLTVVPPHACPECGGLRVTSGLCGTCLVGARRELRADLLARLEAELDVGRAGPLDRRPK